LVHIYGIVIFLQMNKYRIYFNIATAIVRGDDHRFTGGDFYGCDKIFLKTFFFYDRKINKKKRVYQIKKNCL
jgi:hypothetical protein